LALFRAAAAAGLLLVLAPEETRNAISAIFLGAEEARKALPGKDEVAAAALKLCADNASTCAAATRGALETSQKLKP
jgi:hypothetical protein